MNLNKRIERKKTKHYKNDPDNNKNLNKRIERDNKEAGEGERL